MKGEREGTETGQELNSNHNQILITQDQWCKINPVILIKAEKSETKVSRPEICCMQIFQDVKI